MLRSNNMARSNGREFDRTYDRLERAAIAAARRNDAMLLYVPDVPGSVLQTSVTGYIPALVGSPVGRLLDMQYGAPRLGPELLANPSFNSDASGWTPYSNTTLASIGGKLRMGTTTGPSQPMLAIAAIATVPGKTYKFSAASATKTAQVGVFLLQATNNASGAGAHSSTTFGVFGAQSVTDLALIFVASATVTYVVLRADGGGAATTADYSEWDNASVCQIIDNPASRGAELVTNGDFSTWSSDNPVGWGLSYVETASEFVTQGSPGARLVSSGNFNEIAQNVGLVNGKAYEVIVQVTACVGQGAVSNASASPITFTTPGWYRCIFTAVGGSIGLKRSIGGSSSDFTVASISCREVLGYHCTQPTAANKPTLIRIPRRTGPELAVNGKFTSDLSGWVTANSGAATVTWSGGSALYSVPNPLTDGARLRQQVAVIPGRSYWVSAKASASLSISIGSTPGGTDYRAFLTGEQSFSFTANHSTVWFNTVTPSDGSTLDNVSIREIVEWSNAIQLDGADDWMDVSYRDYFGPGNYTFIGSWVGPIGAASSAVLSQTNSAHPISSASAFICPSFFLTNGTDACAFERDDSGNTGMAGSGYASLVTEEARCVELLQTSSGASGNIKGWVGGGSGSNTNYTRAPGAVTTNKITLGAAQRATVFNFAKGVFALLCWAPSVMPIEDRKAIARFASYLVGREYRG